MVAQANRKTKSSKARKPQKPSKPYPDFPLFAHDTGRWAKKIRQRFCYFGPWDDPKGALEKYNLPRDDLYTGRAPRANGDGLTIRDLANRFLSVKQHLVSTRELSPRTWRDYKATCERIIEAFGRTRLVADLAADDFLLLAIVSVPMPMTEIMGCYLPQAAISFPCPPPLRSVCPALRP